MATGQVPTDYQRGYVDGLRAYAWWKDGVQHVGTCGCTLAGAIDRGVTDGIVPTDLHEPALLEACQGLLLAVALTVPNGLQPKDLACITARVAIANATCELVEAGEEQT